MTQHTKSVVTNRLNTISYHLTCFGENLSKIDQAIDLLEDLKEELDEAGNLNHINDYVSGSLSRLKSLKNEVKSILTIVAIAKSKNTNISISENLIAWKSFIAVLSAYLASAESFAVSTPNYTYLGSISLTGVIEKWVAKMLMGEGF